MEKQTKREIVKTLSTYDEDHISIITLLEIIREAMASGATDVRFNSENDSSSIDLDFFFERKETDEELKKRLDWRDKRRKEIEETERKQYEELKKKFLFSK
jgi:hypothetical protein